MISYSQDMRQNDCREGDVNGMSREYVQCQECGKIYQVDIKYDIENDLYERFKSDTNLSFFFSENPSDEVKLEEILRRFSERY